MTADPITINFDSLESAVKKLNIPPQQINKILQLTAAKTARWAHARLSSKLGKALKISLKIRKGRLRLSINSGNAEAQIWLGLDGVSLSRFNPVQTATGVHTDVMDVTGGFILPAGTVFKRKGASRLPIEKQFYDIKNPGITLFDQMVSEVVTQLEKNFERAYLQVLNTR